MRTSDDRPLSCAGCASCPTDDCPAKHDDEETPRLRGPALVGAAVGLFLFPILLAIAGSFAGARAGHVAQFFGCLLGLGAGMALALFTAKLICRTKRGCDVISSDGGTSPSL